MSSPKFISAFLLSTAICSPAVAATLRLDATATSSFQDSDFSIIFDDLDSDGTVSLDEVVSFSGMTSFTIGTTYTELLRLPVATGFVDGEIFVTSSGLEFNTWLFAEGTDRSSIPVAAFTYAITPVPLPATGLLLLASFAGIAQMRRRQKS